MDMTWVYTMNDNTHTLLKFAKTIKQRVRAVELVTADPSTHIRELRRSEDSLLWGRAQRKLFIAPSTSPPTQMVFHFSSSACPPWASFIFPIILETLPQAFWIEYIIQLTGCTLSPESARLPYLPSENTCTRHYCLTQSEFSSQTWM